MHSPDRSAFDRALLIRDGFAFCLAWQTGYRGTSVRTAILEDLILPGQGRGSVRRLSGQPPSGPEAARNAASWHAGGAPSPGQNRPPEFSQGQHPAFRASYPGPVVLGIGCLCVCSQGSPASADPDGQILQSCINPVSISTSSHSISQHCLLLHRAASQQWQTA